MVSLSPRERLIQRLLLTICAAAAVWTSAQVSLQWQFPLVVFVAAAVGETVQRHWRSIRWPIAVWLPIGTMTLSGRHFYGAQYDQLVSGVHIVAVAVLSMSAAQWLFEHVVPSAKRDIIAGR